MWTYSDILIRTFHLEEAELYTHHVIETDKLDLLKNGWKYTLTLGSSSRSRLYEDDNKKSLDDILMMLVKLTIQSNLSSNINA